MCKCVCDCMCTYMCMQACTHHSTNMEVRRQLLGVNFFFPTWTNEGLNTSYQDSVASTSIH